MSGRAGKPGRGAGVSSGVSRFDDHDVQDGRGRKVVVAMSGGVDSSVAAALLQRRGFDVIGAFLRLGSPDGVGSGEGESCELPAPGDPPKRQKQGCCSVLDAGDARRVADLLSIPFYVLNFRDEFSRVIDYFVGEYNRGRTPNPCVRCNDWLKFGRLERYATAVGADFVASGHYARVGVDEATGERTLLRGVDAGKDQSYVLFGIRPENLARTLLPVGGYEKSEIRAMAAEFGLPVFDKPDSQEICFVPDQDYAGLVARRTPEAVRAGEIVSPDGRVLGGHAGHQHFTVGQRRGLGVAADRPLYVLGVEPATNRVTVGGRESLLRSSLVAGQINVVHPTLRGAAGPVRCSAKIRSKGDPTPATAEVVGAELRLTFDVPQAAVAPGQAVVLYDGDAVLGGGWIESAA